MLSLAGVRCDAPPTPPPEKHLVLETWDGESLTNVGDPQPIVCKDDSKMTERAKQIAHCV